jgi:hypothetical protein
MKALEDQRAIAAAFFALRNPANPSPAKPSAAIAQVGGSGMESLIPME